MAVVSEPPWVNFNSGVSPRNGTTTHTINFGFTSTSGNELVFVVHGAVTHTNAGWTKRVAPVQSGELSVFTKTSAGESSFTDTNNGANYPVVWAVYELPSGSTWTASNSGNPTTNTYPALSGLPGTEVVVWAAKGRIVPTPGLTQSAVWSGSWVEDCDLLVDDDGSTDGAYLTIGRQINVTATSITPTSTESGTISSSDDRQIAVFAMNVAALTPGVNAGVDASHTVNTQFTRTATETLLTNVTARNWEIVSGPSGAVSSIGTAAALTWTPSVSGSYVLRYSATHDGGTVTDDATITVVNPQPTKVSDRGSAQNITAQTSTAVALTTPTAIATDNYLVARVAVDNSGTSGAAPGCTVTDPRSNTWTVLGPALSDPGAASAGAAAYLCYTKVTTAYQAGDSLTFNWGGVSTTAKAVVVEEWTNIHTATPVAVSAVTANAAASSALSIGITPDAADQLVYTCLATEGPTGDTAPNDTDTTNGSWASLTRLSTTSGTATNNQTVAGQYKVVSASGAQTWNSTITARDWAAIAVVFAPPPTQQTYSGAASLTATGALTVSGALGAFASASLNATSGLSVAGVRTTDGSVNLSSAPTLTADGIRTTSGAVALSTSATLTVGAQLEAQADVSLPMTASLSAEGTGIPSGGVSLIATATLSPGVVATYFGSVSLTSSSTLSVSGGAILSGAVSLDAASALSVDAIRITDGSVALSIDALLSSDGLRTTAGVVTLTVDSALSSDGIRTTSGAVALSVTSTLTSDGIRIAAGAVSLSAVATLSASGSLPSDTPPTVTAGRARPVARGSTVVLDVVATPPGGQTISGHSWTIQSGGGSLTGASTATPIYSPPESGTGMAVIRDTVTASGGGSAFADVTVSYHTNVVAAENALTGVARSTWDLPTSALGGISTLQGFCDGFTVNKGQTANFKIAQSDTAGWTANLYRLGYYGGNGARDYGPLNPTTAQGNTSRSQPAPTDVDTTTTRISASCANWSVTLTWDIPTWVPSGIFVLKLNRTGGGASHVMFIVRDDARTADFMFMPADTTWMAYNAFGGMGSSNWLAGNSFYYGTNIDQYNSDCGKFVSYDKPFVNREAATNNGATGYGAVEWSTFFTGEYPMLRFMERNGIDTKYYSCLDAAGDSGGTHLIGNGSTRGGVGAAIFVGHNEYWSSNMRTGWETAKAAGINIFSCAGNEVFWRIHPVAGTNDSEGRPRQYECYKSTIASRGSTGRPEWTGTWRDPDGAGKGGNNPENTFTGTIFVVNGPENRSMVVPFAGGYSAQPLWRHTSVASLTSGQSYTTGNQILGFEWDTYGPAGVTTLAANYLAAPHPQARYCSNATYTIGNGTMLNDAGDVYDTTGNATHRLVVHPNGPNGGITFGTGSINWSFGCDNSNTYQGTFTTDNMAVQIQQATINMFCDMGANAATLMAGLTAPTAVDWFPSGATVLTASASLTAGASAVSTPGAATLTASSSLSAEGQRTTTGAAVLAPTAALSVSGVRTTTGSVLASAVGVLSVAVSLRTTTGVASLGSLSTLSVSGVRITSGALSLPTTTVLVVNGIAGNTGSANLASSTALLVNGVLTKIGAAQLNSSSSLSVLAGGELLGAIDLSAVVELLSDVSAVIKIGAATLVASSTLNAGIVRTTTASLALVASALLQFIEVFPEIDFAVPVGRWNDHRPRDTRRYDDQWVTAGIHTESTWS